MKHLTALLLVALGMLLPATVRAEPVDELVRRADMVFRGKTSAAVLEMEIKTKSYERSFRIVAWDDSRGGDRSLIKILGPASWRGHATLKVGDQLKLFNPNTNHVQIVGHSMLGDSWMGSHFSNDDLVKETRLARDYVLTLDKKWAAPAPIGGSATFYRVSMLPKPTAPVGWGRIEYELWESPEAISPVSASYYRRAADAAPARTIRFAGMQKMSDRWVPTTMTVTLASKPGEHTRLEYKKLKLDVDIPPSKFTEQAMRH